MNNLRQRPGQVGEIAARVEQEILVLFITMIAVVVFFGVVIRHTPITAKALWTVELARLFLLLTAFWAAGSIERVSGHFRIEVLEKLVKGKCVLFMQLFVKLAVLITAGILVWWSIAYCPVVWGVETHALHWPEMTLVLPLILGGLLIFTYSLIAFIRIFRRLFE